MLLHFALSLALISPVISPKPQAGLRIGDAWTATYSQTFLEPGTEEVVEAFTYKVDAKVLKVTAKGIETEERTELVESRLGEIVVPPPKGATPLVAKVLIGPNGERAVDPSAIIDPIEFRLARPLWFVGPRANAGGSESRWSVKLPGTESPSVPDATITFELVAREQHKRRPSTRYSATFREEGGGKLIAASGTFVIDDATKLPAVIELRGFNALIPGGDGTRFDVKLTLATSISQ